MTLGPDERREPHTHDFAVPGLVLAGELILAREGREDHYPAGSTFALVRACPHFEAAGGQGATYLAGRLP